jgi:hypothetical protein
MFSIKCSCDWSNENTLSHCIMILLKVTYIPKNRTLINYVYVEYLQMYL